MGWNISADVWKYEENLQTYIKTVNAIPDDLSDGDNLIEFLDGCLSKHTFTWSEQFSSYADQVLVQSLHAQIGHSTQLQSEQLERPYVEDQVKYSLIL